MNTRHRSVRIGLSAVAVLLIGGAGLLIFSYGGSGTPRLTDMGATKPPILGKTTLHSVGYTPNVPDIPIAPDLSNVQGIDKLKDRLSERDRRVLAASERLRDRGRRRE